MANQFETIEELLGNETEPDMRHCVWMEQFLCYSCVRNSKLFSEWGCREMVNFYNIQL